MNIRTFALRVVMIVVVVTGIACSPSEEQAALAPQEQARQALLDKGIEFNLDAYLQYVARGDLEVTKLFLDAGMNVDETTTDSTALAMISSSHSPKMIRLLLENGADANGKSTTSFIPIMRATLANDL